jgi:hypothetical protein
MNERTNWSVLPDSASEKFEISKPDWKPVVNVPVRSASSPMKYMGTMKKIASQIAPGPSRP